ncbi:hypothetical protein H4582DRAFT_955351 [Lactarius indigo]|nr:hypothetical protein H4582DRAFT_955351 [Lactarius indigo]
MASVCGLGFFSSCSYSYFLKTLVVYTFRSHTPCIHFHAHVQASISYFNILSSNMPSHKTLALLALAASTASPALSAPLMYGSCISTLGKALADVDITFLGRARRRPAPVQPFPASEILSRQLHPALASALCPSFWGMSLVATARVVTCRRTLSLMVSPFLSTTVTRAPATRLRHRLSLMVSPLLSIRAVSSTVY